MFDRLIPNRVPQLVAVLLVLGGTSVAQAWNTSSCPVANPSSGACTCVSNGVQTWGNFTPIGCKTTFQPGESIGTWQSINQPPSGWHTWTFDYGYKATEASPWHAQYATNTTQMTISSGVAFWNVWDNKLNTHPPGHYRVQVYFDGQAVANGYKEFSVCGGDYRKACAQGHVYWYDACGAVRSMAQHCGAGTCSGGACTCDQQASSACHGGDVWWLDCGGQPTSMKSDCGAGTCSGGACVCSQQASSACHGGDVWWLDCGGQPTSMKSDCGAGSCSGGACTCDPQASSACHGGDVWWLDCGGQPTSIKNDCGVGSCSGGACTCNPQASSACHGGDVWWLDCGGQPTSMKSDCGAGSCSGGACVCSQQASSACHGGDVWWLDCGGQPTSMKSDCGAGSCSGGVCVCNPQASSACHGGDVWWLDCGGQPTSMKSDCGTGSCNGGACSGPTPDPGPSADPITLHCSHQGPYSVLGWAFDDALWHVVVGSPYHHGDDIWADDWNTSLGGCDTEITLGPMWVRAVASGKVIYAGDASNGYGLQVIVQLSNDATYAVRYAHLDPRDGWAQTWQVGDQVALGDVIGAVGNTGGDYCAHLHLVLYCNIGAGSTAEARLKQGRPPTSTSGPASFHATWFRLDAGLLGDVGGAREECDPFGEESAMSGDFIGHRGVARGCTAGAPTDLWFVGREGQDVAVDLMLTAMDGTPDWGLATLVDDNGRAVPVTVVELSQGVHRFSAVLPEPGRWWVRVESSFGGEARWRLMHDAVADGEPDEHGTAALVTPGSDAVYAIDRPGDVDLFVLGSVSEGLQVRVAPTSDFPAHDVDIRFLVVGDGGELAPHRGPWVADDAWQRTLGATDEAVFLEVTGAPGLYRLAVDAVGVASPPEPPSVVAPPNDDSGGCDAASPSGSLHLLCVLLALLVALRRARTVSAR